MATLYPTDREHRLIQRTAEKGDESAKHSLALLDACTQALEGSNGITLARGLSGEHDDAYGGAIDDALAELFPVIWECVKDAGGWESLKFYLPTDVVASPSEGESDTQK